MLDINKYLVNKILAFLAIAVFTVHANASDISSKDFALKINQCVETLYADKTTYPTREQIPIELIIAMAAALGALMPCARSAVAPQVHLFGRWRKQKPGASRRCSGDFKIFWSSQRMETVLPRSVTTRCAESASHCTAGWIALAQFAPKTRPSLVCLDHRQRPRGAHME